MEWLESLVLGAVQGLTEFLPVSSDGHLRITQQAFAWLTGSSQSGEQNLFFVVMLHLGTLAAILVYYRELILQGLRGLLGSVDVPSGFQRGDVVRVGLLAAVATSPLIPLALFFKKFLEEAFESDVAAGYGFLVTAAVLLLTTWLSRRSGTKGPAETTWLDALLIGLAQMFAPLPGVSRSGLTIAMALALGLTRIWSVGFSLLIAVPAICGGLVFELKDADLAGITPDRAAQIIVATVISGVVGYAAILWLIRVVRAGRLWYFSVYLVMLACVVLAAVSLSPGSADARPEKALDRTAGSRASGTRPKGGGDGFIQPLGGSNSPGQKPGDRRARLEIQVGGFRPTGLLLG